jgi:hypothetical protein
MAMNGRKGRALGGFESLSDGGARVLTASQKAVMLPREESSILFVKADGKEPELHGVGAGERTAAVSCKCILLDFLAGAPCGDEKFVRLHVCISTGAKQSNPWCFFGRHSAQVQSRARAMLAQAAPQPILVGFGMCGLSPAPAAETGDANFL